MHNFTLHHKQLSLDGFTMHLLDNELLFPIGEHDLLKVPGNLDEQL